MAMPPSDAFIVIYSCLPVTRGTGALACSCKAAAAAWQAYAAWLTRDISGGQEQLPVPVNPPPHTSRAAPLPLDTRYTRDSVHGAAAVGDIPGGQGGCRASCSCCRQQLDDAVDQNSLVKSLFGEGKAHASAADTAAPAAKRPRRCNDDDSSSSHGAIGGRSSSGSSSSSEESDGEGWSCCGCGVLMPAGVRAYQPNGRGLKPELLAQASAAAFILECGPACACRHPAPPAHSTRGATTLVDAGGGNDTATPPGRVLGCAARLTQHGLAARVRLSWVTGKGWAAFAAEPLPAGAFVCRYEGELLRSGEAERRLLHVYDRSSSSHCNGSSSSSSSSSGSTGGFCKEEGEEVERKEVGRATDACVRGQGDSGGGGAGRQRPRIGGDGGTREGGDSADGAGAGEGHALLVVREVLPSGLALRLNIDATRLGNVARFFNHSCDGGCLLPVVVRRRGSLVPGVGLFARRDISVGEELTFPYGAPNAGPGGAAPLEEQRRATPAADAGVGACVGGGHGGDVKPGKAREEASRAEHPARQLQAGQGQSATGVGSTGVERSSAKRAPTPRRCLCGTSACLGFMPADPA